MAYISRNPYTEQVEHKYASISDAELESRLALAHQRFLTWCETPVPERCETLRRLAAAMTERRDALAEVLTRDMGKLKAEALAEVDGCIATSVWYADNGVRLLRPRREHGVNYKGGVYEIVPTPTGVVYAVEPWNFPYSQVTRVLVPQLLVGNTVVLKHASIVPTAAVTLERLVEEIAGPGLLVNLFISHAQSAAVIADDRVAGVALTGSEGAGAIVASQAGAALKRSTLELGGSDALIVLEDADVARTAAWAVRGRHRNSGQVCVSSKRMIVLDAVYDAFVAAYRKGVAGLVAGDPLDPATTYAPLSSEQARADLQAQVERAVAAGATAEEVDIPLPDHGWFMRPVILTGVTPDNPAYAEEFFGPVTQLYRVADEEAAIRLANDTPYGLGGSVFTGDEARGRRVALRLDTGMVAINRPVIGGADTPFGGTKRSGYGREYTDLGLYEFVNQKVIGAGEIAG
ncbi:aldehyde dehydrogenase family protein [Pseudoclavibacter caeni]|jgi:succinate-semialdehyde dehydrogenase / glutarate-semialdehyde dehydrogenase|uniref:Aldehyde dehydrogenase family protein n=1 Tax=Pseudoclavibacter caeni TaxID=908846 RepID=A0A7C8FVJ7_9MICO|nr:aldehyde dehydrogenase family protein [Pseudoclavibacter caeni]KAB1633678.1 aldehyde dehydrogenase family protein [Pseudoclavibacter caeni]NYJ96302.1 succinate-semialdehyde dehydrogenase/glutarate-semialdehyde dehydrogenase [Pseudoclavibacter caeni]